MTGMMTNCKNNRWGVGEGEREGGGGGFLINPHRGVCPCIVYTSAQPQQQQLQFPSEFQSLLRAKFLTIF